MRSTTYYFAANRYEGCGHRHRRIEHARACLRRVVRRTWDRSTPRGYVLRVTTTRIERL